MVESPCIKLCRFDKKGYCEGCFRTAEEISQWIEMNDQQKREILKRIEQRQMELF